MNRFENAAKSLLWVMPLLLVTLVTGCGGNDPILGGGSIAAIATDTSRPRVTFTEPLNAASGVSTNRKITATFSENMLLSSITTSSFTLTCAASCVSPTSNSVSYATDSKTATFTPGQVLAASQVYTATITTAATDMAGNALAGNPASAAAASNYVWTFTTGGTSDATAPFLLSTAPMDGASGVPINNSVNVKFSEPMDQSTISAATFKVQTSGPPLGSALAGAISYNPQANIATFTPSSYFAASTVYTATVVSGVAGVKDLAGMTLVASAVPNPWTFTTSASGALAPSAIALGSAASFGIASRAGLTTTGVTVINGDVALYPLATCTDATGNSGAGQSCLVKIYSSTTGMTVNGSIYWAGDPYNNGATAYAVTNDLNTAWVEGKNKVDTQAGVLLGELGAPGPVGKIITPGVYHEAALGLAAGNVATFDALNDANAIFIIKVDSSFTDSGTLANPTSIKLINGAQAKNIWFVTGEAITIGSGTSWNGNILAGGTATVNKGSTVNGRLLAGAAGAGAITLTGDASPSITTITVPQ